MRATRDAGAWQCPTLGTSIYTAPSSAIERYLATPEAEYLDQQTREAFRHRGRVKWLSNFTEADFERATRANDKQAVLLRAMHKAGVPLLAGTDSNSFGFALHRELEALVEIGLSPGEALQTATINPARFAGLEKAVGRVATGYAADLILLDANPLQAIRNAGRINAVILRGQLLRIVPGSTRCWRKRRQARCTGQQPLARSVRKLLLRLPELEAEVHAELVIDLAQENSSLLA